MFVLKAKNRQSPQNILPSARSNEYSPHFTIRPSPDSFDVPRELHSRLLSRRLTLYFHHNELSVLVFTIDVHEPWRNLLFIGYWPEPLFQKIRFQQNGSLHIFLTRIKRELSH